MILLDQGTLTKPGGLVYMNGAPLYVSSLLTDNYYGQPFNSPNDVAVTSDGALWFIDPTYGSSQGIRPQPSLPAQVYRFMPGTNDVRIMADSFVEPNGLAISPDSSTLYVTDAAGNSAALQAPRTIYDFDVLSNVGCRAWGIGGCLQCLRRGFRMELRLMYRECLCWVWGSRECVECGREDAWEDQGGSWEL